MKCGSLNPLETLGNLQACNGIALPYTLWTKEVLFESFSAEQLNTLFRYIKRYADSGTLKVQILLVFLCCFRNSVMCVCRSVRPSGTILLPLGGISYSLILENYWKICHEDPNFIETWQE